MLLSAHVDVKTGPVCKKAAENELAPLHGTLPRGSHHYTRPEIILRG